jgi:protein-L-isoaspartate(D-aspartate) O-methyltransferase
MMKENRKALAILSGLTAMTAFVLVAACNGTSAQTNDDYAEQRERMVRDHIASDLYGRTPVTNEAVLDAMRTVPRHRFVPEHMASSAYRDSPLPIGHDQTISQPNIVATMTAAIDPKPDDKVLEIGTGSGYQAAVLAEIVDEVYTIEIVEPLGKRAAEVFKELEYENVHTRIGDGYQGWPEAAPFDAIVVTAAPDHVPQPLIEQLAPGGRMIIPVGPQGTVQELRLIEKDDSGEVSTRVLEPVRFVPFTRDEEAAAIPE